MKAFAEYIWIDGSTPVQKLRSKTKVVDLPPEYDYNVNKLPIWNFDGSSTNQATGDDSECLLKPVRVIKDPLRINSFLVLCEVMDSNNNPHTSNKRALLRNIMNNGGNQLDVWWGFEQEYCLINNKTDSILGWPAGAKFYPKPQGEFYCGVGSDEVSGREIVNNHADACLKSDLLIFGQNFEVLLGQAEVQCGYRGIATDPVADALLVSDHLWLIRYLLYRVAEKYDVYITLDPKPKKGDWNGSGCHTNFSDKFMRDPSIGLNRIEKIQVVMEKNHLDHQKEYGYGNERRLTGQHETAPYEKFSMGVANRGVSIRIPNNTKQNGYGYIEDRRVASNCCPYTVTNRILRSLLEIE